MFLIKGGGTFEWGGEGGRRRNINGGGNTMEDTMQLII